MSTPIGKMMCVTEPRNLLIGGRALGLDLDHLVRQLREAEAAAPGLGPHEVGERGQLRVAVREVKPATRPGPLKRALLFKEAQPALELPLFEAQRPRRRLEVDTPALGQVGTESAK
eukprot:CAMPEP_0172624344 /NCGR_PEP_ID=MMETSP1068-20121228/135695_1 /TAXON_ID=35684 /ORGANISM="Pseudopedinella elastica, Strain CCMP716" /LENGTH=115 /DNA_ID=CAMNT_0013433249 /DNA_START=92 /DNA_END=436 /DNA_ORIENTATION=+